MSFWLSILRVKLQYLSHSSYLISVIQWYFFAGSITEFKCNTVKNCEGSDILPCELDKYPVLPSCVSPLISHCYSLTTLLTPDVWGLFPTASKSLWHKMRILKFNSIMTLSGHTIRVHRLRAQSHETTAHFRCQLQVGGPQATNWWLPGPQPPLIWLFPRIAHRAQGNTY